MTIIRELSENWRSVLNYCCITGVHVVVLLSLMNIILKRNRPIKRLLGFLVMKVVVFDVLFWLVLSEFFGDSLIFQGIYSVLRAVIMLISLYLFWWTYEGTATKIIILGMMTELYSVGLGRVAIELSGIADIRDFFYFESIGWKTVRFSAVFLFLHLVICRIFYRKLLKVRDYQIKYVRFWHFVFGVYLVVTWSQTLMDYRKVIRYAYFIEGLFLIFLICCAAIFGISFYRIYRREIYQKHDLLKRKQRLLINHMEMIHSQILQIKSEQKKMNTQMRKFLSLDDDACDDVRIRNYLKELKEQYESVKAGGFCEDQMVDAVLHYYEQICRKQKIRAEFIFSSYRKRDRKENREVEILIIMLEILVNEIGILSEEEKWIFLRGGNVKNCTVLQLKCNPGRKARRIRKSIRNQLKMDPCQIRISKDKNSLQIEILIE